MLGKLMKYESKASSRLLIPLYLILLFLSILNRFIFKLNHYEGVVNVLTQLFLFTYIASIFVVLIVTVFYMIIRFYKNLLTDEGYLMFTLPVKSHELINSKLIMTIFWTIVSIAVVLASLCIVFTSPDNWPSVMNVFKEASASFSRDFGGKSVLMISEMILAAFLSLIVNVLLIYASIAIGQLYAKHKLIASFAAYMVIYTVIQFLMVFVLLLLGALNPSFNLPSSAVPTVVLPVAILVLVLGGSCFYLITNYLIKRKLNLD